MRFGKWQQFSALALGLVFLPYLGMAAIPSGPVQITVTGVTNHLWDVSSIDELQNVEIDISAEDVAILFPSSFDQNGGGKLTGAGVTQMSIDSDIFVGTIDAAYKVSGSVKSAGGVAQVRFSSSAKGLAGIGGQTRTVTGTFAANVTIDSLQQIAFGEYAARATASGVGTVQESGPVDITWTDVVNSMGNGTWTLQMLLANDGVKKIGGTAVVTLSSGAQFDFVVKGSYKSATDTSVLILAAAASSKGSVLKVNLTGSTIKSISGKVSGQAVRWSP